MPAAPAPQPNPDEGAAIAAAVEVEADTRKGQSVEEQVARAREAQVQHTRTDR